MASIPSGSIGPIADGMADRYVDFGAILGGALIATAVGVVLVAFGSALGLSFTSMEPGEGVSLRWVAIAGGLWLIWSAVCSTAAGGYFAGRMRRPAGDADPDEVETRDGAHGVAVWALATLITAVLAAQGVGGAGKVAGAVMAESADTLEAVVSENADYVAGVALRGSSALPSDEARKEFASVLARSLGDDEVSEADRAYLARVITNESGIPPAEARARADQAIADAETTRNEAIEAAEQARIVALIAAFVLATSLLVSAAVAYFAAVLGGKHRNENIGFARFGAARRR